MKNEKPADNIKCAKWSRAKKFALTAIFLAAAAGVVAEGVEKIGELRQQNLTHVRQLPTV